jgi:hypothetical protein
VPGTDLCGDTRAPAVRSHHKAGLDVVLVALLVGVAHARHAPGAPAQRSERAALTDVGALFTRPLDQADVLEVARDADAVVDPVGRRAQALDAGDALGNELDPPDLGRIQRQDPREGTELGELAGACGHQQVRGELIRREAHLVEHDHPAPSAGERRRHCASSEARPDDNHICLLHDPPPALSPLESSDAPRVDT